MNNKENMMKTINKKNMCIEYEKEFLFDKLIAMKIDTINIFNDLRSAKLVIEDLNKSIIKNLYEISKLKLLRPVDTGMVKTLFKEVMKQSIKLNDAYEDLQKITVAYNNQLKRVKSVYEAFNIPTSQLELPKITPPKNEIDNVLNSICYALDSGLNDLTVEMLD